MADDFDKARNADSDSMRQGDIQQFLTFRVMDEEYGVDIMTVREIKGWAETTRLPNSPECMRGVMNLRGSIIPIFDLRARFSSELTTATSSHVVIIVAVNDRNIGILVDAVSDILSVSEDDIRPAPEVESQSNANFIAGLISRENRMAVLLNVEQLFDTATLSHPLPIAV